MSRVDRLSFFKGARGAAPHGGNRPGQFFRDDLLSEVLVGDPVLIEKVIVEEMAEGAVPHVMEKPGEPCEFLDEVDRGGIGADALEAGVEVPAEFAGHVHGSQGVLEPAVLGGGVDPAGALELVDPPQALEPGRVDEVLFRFFPRVLRSRDGEPGVLVDRVGDERLARIDFRKLGTPLTHTRFLSEIGAMFNR